MFNHLLEIINSSGPVKLEASDIEEFISKKFLHTLIKSSQKLIYFCGEEYSSYILNRYSKNSGGLQTFLDFQRYNYKLDEMQFYSTSDSGVASSANLTYENQSLLDNKIYDIRCFIGKKGDASCMHFDWNSCPNILINYYGKKSIQLIPPTKSAYIKGFSNFALPDSYKDDDVSTIYLDEGEGILIPPFWWHKALYLSNSKSISIRFTPPETNLYMMKKLYPSWKLVQLFSSEVHHDTFEELHRITEESLTSHTLFRNIEYYLNSELALDTPDHPYYERFSIDYLNHYIFKN